MHKIKRHQLLIIVVICLGYSLPQTYSISGKVLNSETPTILSVFAGRIADSGIDPIKIMEQSVKLAKVKPRSEILWASTREIINIFQAEAAGCAIITVPHSILNKLTGVGKDLNKISLETVEMFYKDAKAAGYTINTKK